MMMLQVIRIGVGLLLPLCLFWLLTVQQQNGLVPKARTQDPYTIDDASSSLRGKHQRGVNPVQQALDEINNSYNWENNNDDEGFFSNLNYNDNDDDGEDDDDINAVINRPKNSNSTQAAAAANPAALVMSSTDDDDTITTTIEDDDPLTLANLDLIRTRPRNLRIVFVGDSMTRYQYLSLAYFLRFGRWFDPSVFPNNLVNAHSFHHDYHPDEDWNEFFMQSNRMLQPMELCDCVRKDNTVAIERRYFYDPQRNNQLVYINISGKSTLGYEGLYGRANPKTVFNLPFQSGLYRESPTTTLAQDAASVTTHDHPDAWEYFSWADLIEEHVGQLNMGPTALAVAVLNAGLHPNNFRDSLRAMALREALELVNIRGLWKTTSFTKDEIVDSQERHKKLQLRELDRTMCEQLHGCFDMSWTANLNPSLYYDQFHFGEPVYRILNEELLTQLNLLPSGYKKLDRSLVTL